MVFAIGSISLIAYNNTIKDKKVKMKCELIRAAASELKSNIDIVELLKTLFQLRLFIKLFLNENQMFMLQNRDTTFNYKLKVF